MKGLTVNDIKLNDDPHSSRYVILEDDNMEADTLKTIGTIIAPHAKMLRYSHKNTWSQQFH